MMHNDDHDDDNYDDDKNHENDGDDNYDEDDWKICISAWKPYWPLLRKWQALINSCCDIPRAPKVWNVLARNWLQIIQVRKLKSKTYKLETSQSPEY